MLDLTFGATSVGFEYVAPPKPPARANAQSQHQQQQQPLAQKPAGDSPAQLPAAAGPQNPGPVVVPEEGSGPQVALLLMRSGLELLTTLELCCGQDHHDVARVLLDLQVCGAAGVAALPAAAACSMSHGEECAACAWRSVFRRQNYPVLRSV
jgi:hypothetical protein